MLAFPVMLVSPAIEAGMEVPFDVSDEAAIDRERYPHFWMFCQLQLGRRMTSPSEHWGNAKVIADISKERLITMTIKDFRAAGVEGL